MRVHGHKIQISFGLWDIHCGADPFGPAVRDALRFEELELVILNHLMGG